MIFYGDSRCHEAISHISKADAQHQLWMQQCLKDKLVCKLILSLIGHCIEMSIQLFIMSYVGIATSLNLVVDISIILHSLSLSLLAVPNKDLPIQFDTGMIDMVHSGTTGPPYG